MTAAADELWALIVDLCPPGPPPCAAIARRTGLADATVSDWFRKHYVPPWSRFERLLGYFPDEERTSLVAAWHAAREPRLRPGPDTQREVGAGPPRRGPAIAQLPYDIADFTGRAEIAQQLERMLTDDAGSGLVLVGVQGMAGSGKTRLAVHVLRRIALPAWDVQLFADLGGNAPGREPVPPSDILAALLRSLGAADADIPEDLEERAALYRARLDGRRALILLDDAASAEQVRPLLPGSSSCRVVVTSRQSLDGLDGSRPIVVNAFDDAEALLLIQRVVGAERTAREPDAVRRLITLTAGLPLAVSIAARRLRSRPAWRIADLVERLEGEESRLAELAASDIAVRAAFALSYQQLPDRLRRVFRRLAAVPGRIVGAHTIAAVTGESVDDAEHDLESLLDAHLIIGVGVDRYAQHDLLALFARERFTREDTEIERENARRRGVEWYLRTAMRAKELVGREGRRMVLAPSDLVPYPLATAAEANDWYDRERSELDAAQSTALALGYDDLAWRLPVTLFGFCRARQSWRQFRPQLIAAMEAAERSGDPAGVAWTNISMGIGESMLGRRADSDAHFTIAVRISRELGDREGEGVALNNLGENRRLDGDHAAALALFHQDLALARSRGDRVATASSLDNIGKAELGRGHLDAARKSLAEALDLATEAADRHGEAEIRGDLGQLALAEDDRVDASRFFRRSAALYEEIGDLASATAAQIDLAEAAGDPTRTDSARALLDRIDEPFASELAERLDRVRIRLESQPPGAQPMRSRMSGPASTSGSPGSPMR